MEITTLQIVLVFIVACIAGMGSILDEFQFHRPLIAASSSSVSLVTLAACWDCKTVVHYRGLLAPFFYLED